MDKQQLRDSINQSKGHFLVNGYRRKLRVIEDELKDLEDLEFSLIIPNYRIAKLSTDMLFLIERFTEIEFSIKRV